MVFDIDADIIDSRDVIHRINELETNDSLDTEEAEELNQLLTLVSLASDSPDWEWGEQIINESYFVQYIEELIDSCYSLPPELTSGNWPYRHITIDYDSAAGEAKQDYIEFSWRNSNYLIRA